MLDLEVDRPGRGTRRRSTSPASTLPPRLRPGRDGSACSTSPSSSATPPAGSGPTCSRRRATSSGGPSCARRSSSPARATRSSRRAACAAIACTGRRVPTQKPYRFMLATRSTSRIVAHERPDLIEVGSAWFAPVAGAPRHPARGCAGGLVLPQQLPARDRAVAARRAGRVRRAAAEFAWRYVRRLGRMVRATLAPSDFVAARARAGRGRARRARVGSAWTWSGFHPAPARSGGRDAPPPRPARGPARDLRRTAGGGEGGRPAARGVAARSSGAPARGWCWSATARRAVGCSGAAEAERVYWLPFQQDRDRAGRPSRRGRPGGGAVLDRDVRPVRARGARERDPAAVRRPGRRGRDGRALRAPARRSPRATPAPWPTAAGACCPATSPRSARAGGDTPRRTTAGTRCSTASSTSTADILPVVSLLVSIHDVTPALADGVERLWALCAGARRAARRSWWCPTGMAHGRSRRIRTFVAWLRARVGRRRRDRAPRRAARRGRTAPRARRRAPGLGPHGTRRRVSHAATARRARADRARARPGFGALGLEPVGFVPPAWLARDEGHRSRRASGARRSARTTAAIHLFPSGRRLPSPVVRWSARTPCARLGLGRGGPGALGAAGTGAACPRIAFHPQDLGHPATAAALGPTLDRWLARHRPIPYRSLRG